MNRPQEVTYFIILFGIHCRRISFICYGVLCLHDKIIEKQIVNWVTRQLYERKNTVEHEQGITKMSKIEMKHEIQGGRSSYVKENQFISCMFSFFVSQINN